MKIKRSEIDAAIAKEVMGWKFSKEWNYRKTHKLIRVDKGGDSSPSVSSSFDWHPSTDLNHAYKAWQHLKSKNEEWLFSVHDSVDDGPCVDISDSDGMLAMDCTDENPALAICLALLSAVRGESVELES